MSTVWNAQSVSELGSLLFASKNSFHASFCLLIYDHAITLDQEISRIWSSQWNAHKVLFLLNRYISPTQFAIQLLTLDLPAFSGEHCKPIYRLPYASALYSTAMAEIILILRTYALYGLSKRILLFLAAIFVGHVIIMILATMEAHRYDIPEGFVACTLTAQGLTNVFFWAAPWIADTVIFFLTLWKTTSMRKSVGKLGVRMPLLTVLARDGLIYYSVIVGIDTVNLGIYLFTAQKIKPMGAAFCQVLTTAMINRLQLNLRSPCITHNRLPERSTTIADEKGKPSKCSRCQKLQKKICLCEAASAHDAESGGVDPRLSTMRSLSYSMMMTPSSSMPEGTQIEDAGTFDSTLEDKEVDSEPVRMAKAKAEPETKGEVETISEMKGKAKASALKRPTIDTRTESRRYLTRNLSRSEELGPRTGSSETEGETIDMNEFSLSPTLTSASAHTSASASGFGLSQCPSWWFDRQVLSLGGVCEYEDGEKEGAGAEDAGTETHTPRHDPNSPTLPSQVRRADAVFNSFPRQSIPQQPSPSSSRVLVSPHTPTPSNVNTISDTFQLDRQTSGRLQSRHSQPGQSNPIQDLARSTIVSPAVSTSKDVERSSSSSNLGEGSSGGINFE